jgi:hypothetical protein
MSQFDFENLEPWDPTTSSPSLLPVGDHVVTIDNVESSKTRNGNNQLVVDASNANGSRKDWIVYAEENGARKVVALAKAAGVRLPGEDDQKADGQLTDAYAGLFAGKTAGMVVRLEDSYKNPGTQEPRVKGWVPASQISADVPIDSADLMQPTGSADDDIPF